MDLQHIFGEAVQLHTKGQFDQAAEKYRQVLEHVPHNVNVLGNLGLVCRAMGQLEEALRYCLLAVEYAPGDASQHLNLGAVYESLGNLPQARACYEKALHFEPTHPQALNNLGKILHVQGQREEALASLKKAVALVPDYPLALNNLGVLLGELGDLDNAALHLERALGLDPLNRETMYNLAGLYNCLDREDRARELLEELVKLDPGHPSANHMLAALIGKTTEMAPREYVIDTFDRYAGRFDEHLQGALQYSVPADLATMLKQVRPEAHYRNCLDLGCGTGLSGSAFRRRCDNLVGVDLSPAMLSQAQRKDVYGELVCDDVLSFLQREKLQYDLFLATDLFIYLGRLDPVFAEISRCAAAGAVFAVSFESHQGSEEYFLRHTGRYAHSSHYVEKVARRCGFSVLCRREKPIRKESNSWIPGELYIFEMARQ